MAYLGNSPSQQSYAPAVDYFSGNGSTTAFTLSRPVATTAQMIVAVANVPQNPGSAYTVNGSTITFASAPPTGTNNIWVNYTSPITQVNAVVQAPSIIGPVSVSNNGAALPFSPLNPSFQVASNVNSYTQFIMQNNNSGTSASTDFIVNNDQGTDSTNYGDFGINSSTYSGTGPFSTAGGVYLYSQSSSFALGTAGAFPVTFSTNNTENGRFDTSGNFLLGTTTSPSASKAMTFSDGSYQTSTSLGYSPQAWTNETSSRAVSTTYTNSTGRPIMVGVQMGSSTAGATVALNVGGVVATAFSQPSGVGGQALSAVVPNGTTYSVTLSAGSATLVSWSELR
jgi:hypothetical protein